MGSKFHGKVGYGPMQTEISPGVVDLVIVERECYGESTRPGANSRLGETALPTVTLTNQVQILMDGYAMENYHEIQYLILDGVYWTVTQVEISRPRLLLRLGGVYHGPKA